MRKKALSTLLVAVLLAVGAIVFLKYSKQEEGGVLSAKSSGNITPGKVYRRPALSFAPAGHIICMLGGGETITAISGGLLRDRLLLKRYPFIRDLPVIKRGGAINLEEMIRTGPDIVFISPEAALDERTREKIIQTGIPYFAPSFNTMEEQIEAVKEIGRALGRMKKAERYEEFYRKILALTGERLKSIKQKKRVYYSILEVNRTFGEKTLGYNWLDAAGLRNGVLDDKLKISNNKYFISVEQIIAMDPEIILANEESAEMELMTSKKFRSIDAVKKGKVYKMPNGISRWGHATSFETPLAILWTAKKVYPAEFGDVPLDRYVKDFYREFFEIELDNRTLKKILSGRGMRNAKNNRKHR